MKQIYPHCNSFLLKTLLVSSCLAIFFTSKAQQCNTFYNAVNPIKAAGFPDYIWHPDFIDIDNDGDLDCYVRKYDNYYGEFAIPTLYRNIGNAKTPYYREDTTSDFAPQPHYFSESNSQFVDIDGDGDYDYFVGEDHDNNDGYNLRIHFFKNTGTKLKPVFVQDDAENPVSFFAGYYSDIFTFADMDGDGDYDFYIRDDFFKNTYYNTGSAKAASYTLHAREDLAGRLDRTYIDWNKDGLMDYFEHNEAYNVAFMRNTGPVSNPQYVEDNAAGAVFTSAGPYRFFDLNNDGSLDIADELGNYNTLANAYPVINAGKYVYKGFTAYKLTGAPVGNNLKYQWRFNGKNIPAATTPSLVAFAKGYYTFTVTNNCGTSLSAPFVIGSAQQNIIAQQSAGNSSLQKVAVQVYPNPFSNLFTIQLLQATCNTYTAKVTTLAGRVLLQKALSGNNIVTTGNWPGGVYILQLYKNNMLIQTQKLVKE